MATELVTIPNEVLRKSSAYATRPIEIGLLEPGEEPEWDRFVTASPSATFFHLSAWETIVERVLGHRCYRLVARGDDGITGVFPISLICSRLFGDCMVSMPLAVYGGVCADDEISYYALLHTGRNLAHRLGVKYLEMRNRTELYPASLPGRDLYVTFTQDLSVGAEKLLQGLPRDTRYMVRKSLKAGLAWTEDLHLKEFYEIYARSVHRLGTPVFSQELFGMLRSEFPGQCRLFGVRKGKTAVAGVMCFYFRDQVLPFYAGALDAYYKDAPNNFMYWSLIEQSCREGYGHFDFGRSKRDTGSYSFKSSWAMQISDLPYRYQLVRANSVPSMSAADRKFQIPIQLWKKMPFHWTKAVGPRLIPFIPSV